MVLGIIQVVVARIVMGIAPGMCLAVVLGLAVDVALGVLSITTHMYVCVYIFIYITNSETLHTEQHMVNKFQGAVNGTIDFNSIFGSSKRTIISAKSAEAPHGAIIVRYICGSFKRNESCVIILRRLHTERALSIKSMEAQHRTAHMFPINLRRLRTERPLSIKHVEVLHGAIYFQYVCES